MKTISRIMAATALVSVVGCGKLPNSSLGGTFGVEPFIQSFIPSEGLTGGQVYSAALAREYQALARIAATEDVNWIDATAYMEKSLLALKGARLQPWAPDVLGLHGESELVYQRVVATLNQNAGRNPIACARVMALYDNYLEELSEGAHSCTDPAVILAELDEQIAACGFAQVVAPPAPVYVAPPAPVPAPVYVEPAPVAAPVYVEPAPVAAPVYVEPAPVAAPVYVEPAPVVPFDACSTVSVPGNCTCDGASGNPVLTCEKIVTREVQVPGPERVVERVVEIPAEPTYVAPPPPPPPAYTPPPPAQPSYPLNYTIYFGYDRYDLTAEARQVIDEAVAAFRAYAAPFMDIVGHTDSRGSKSYNTRLAQRRADAVAGAVTSRGVDGGSLRVSASSELDPAVSTGDGVREALNRRVSITIVQ